MLVVGIGQSSLLEVSVKKLTNITDIAFRGFTGGMHAATLIPFFRVDGQLYCNNNRCGSAAARLLLQAAGGDVPPALPSATRPGSPVPLGGPSNQPVHAPAGRSPEQSRCFVRVSALAIRKQCHDITSWITGILKAPVLKKIKYSKTQILTF